MTKILVAGDSREFRDCVGQALLNYNIQLEFVACSDDVLPAVANEGHSFWLLLLDFKAASAAEIRTAERIAQSHAGLQIIAIADPASLSGKNELDKLSNCRVLTRPVSSEQLLAAITSIIDLPEQTKGSCEVKVSNPAVQDDLMVSGNWSQRAESLLLRIGASNVPVLLRGETGVGKEVIARRLHSFSRRADRPFIKLNCAALPSELVESELFGYDRGAFTGAFKNTPGKFEMANKGTILLDEIGDMDPKLQAKLLQVLQDQEFYRLGSHEPSRIDVRIMAASHCDFERAIEEKRFREDLYYRLNIVEIKIPPLRERRNEILPLCELFLQQHSTVESPKLEIAPILRQVLLEYSWPGNVRELENMMRKYLVIRNPGILAAEIRQRTVKAKSVYVPAEEMKAASNFSEAKYDQNFGRRVTDLNHRRAEVIKAVAEIPSYRPANTRETPTVQELPRPTLVSLPNASENRATLSKVDEARRTAEADAILAALQSSLWNRKRAAMLLNVDYKALLYKMKKLGIGEKKVASCG